jgi:hypothetical protein
VRKLFDVQLALGAVPIEKVEIPTKTGNELPPILAGLQWIFNTPEVNREVFAVLETIRPVGAEAPKKPPVAPAWTSGKFSSSASSGSVPTATTTASITSRISTPLCANFSANPPLT